MKLHQNKNTHVKFLTVALALVLTLFGGVVFGQTTQTFTTNGSFTIPCGVTSVTIGIWGGGGGGGGSSASGSGGSGGGGGAYVVNTFVVAPGNTINYTIGGGGTAGVSAGGTGGAGGQSTATGPGINMSANGGTGGAGNAGAIGSGATLGVGGTVTAGSNGQIGGASGGNGGTGGNGGAGGNGTINGAGLPGSIPGGGGGGGERSGGTNFAGGSGATGQISFTYTSSITSPNAGIDQSSCSAISLAGNTPDAGWTGTWSVIAGSATITSPNSPTSGVSGIASGSCATIRWTFSMAGCTDMTDDVIICVPSICNDDPCNADPLTVTSGTCSFSTFSNVGATMSTGMPEPGCAVANGPDVWFAVTVPASGQLQVSGQVQGTFDPLISIYDGPCGSLEFNGCVSGSGSNVYPLTYAGAPGTVIYIRVNEGGAFDATEGSFGVCAYEATTATISEVLPGVTTMVDCGTPLNFYDPGGQGGTTSTSTAQPPPAGNYSNNTGAQWIICPSDPSEIVTINFTEFTVETGYDKLIILSGDNVIAQWTGNDGQGDIVTAQVAGECLTVILQSDYIWTAEGWEAIVSCTTAVVPPQITTACQVNNCNGGCGVWVCADGIYDTQAGAGAGIDEMNEVLGGCWGAAGEVATSWFYFTTASAGELAFEFVPSNSGHNINFALYGPSNDGVPPCPLSTGDAPIRCSYATPGGINTGMQTGQTDLYDIASGDGMAAPLTVGPGETYALVVDVYQNGQPPTQTEIDFTGAVTLDCTPVLLGITLEDFSGINQGPKNLLSWTISSQTDNDYFTLERSVNGIDWEIVGNIDGAGTTTERMFYSLIDNNPYFPVSYYRLKQTDFDGKFTRSDVIAISTFKDNADDFINNLFPNPTSDYATFVFSGRDTETTLNVRVLNEIGQIVSEYNYIEPYEGMPATIETFDLSTGLYQVLFTQGENKQMQKLAIIR